MGILSKFFAPSPFAQLHEHTKKVHECVELLRPLASALLAEDYEKIEELHNVMSKTEHEADQIKTELRDRISKMYFLSVGRLELSRFLAYQDDVADAAEDFAVVLLLRKTKVPEQLKADFMTFVKQVINVSEHLLNVAEKLSILAEAADKIDPITIIFLDKYCKTLSQVSNNAEKTAKYLRLIIRKK
jgi:predicted phosphate transport protein (TIGR00153 family)